MGRYLFLDLIDGNEAEYLKNLSVIAEPITKVVDLLARVFQVVSTSAQANSVDNTRGCALSLFRHVIEQIDAVDILLRSGITSPGLGHLRSSFEAMLSLNFLLQGDTELNAAAYRFKELLNEEKRINSLDPTTQYGMEVKTDIADGIYANCFEQIAAKIDVPALRAKIKKRLQSATFNELQSERKAIKRFGWYAAFDGPKNLKELAKKVGFSAMYYSIYSDWSGQIHAGKVTSSLAKPSDGEMNIAYRQIRLPLEYSTVATFSDIICMESFGVMRNFYLSDFAADSFVDEILKEVKPAKERASRVRLNLQWK